MSLIIDMNTLCYPVFSVVRKLPVVKNTGLFLSHGSRFGIRIQHNGISSGCHLHIVTILSQCSQSAAQIDSPCTIPSELHLTGHQNNIHRPEFGCRIIVHQGSFIPSAGRGVTDHFPSGLGQRSCQLLHIGTYPIVTGCFNLDVIAIAGFQNKCPYVLISIPIDRAYYTDPYSGIPELEFGIGIEVVCPGIDEVAGGRFHFVAIVFLGIPSLIASRQRHFTLDSSTVVSTML